MQPRANGAESNDTEKDNRINWWHYIYHSSFLEYENSGILACREQNLCGTVILFYLREVYDRFFLIPVIA